MDPSLREGIQDRRRPGRANTGRSDLASAPTSGLFDFSRAASRLTAANGEAISISFGL